MNELQKATSIERRNSVVREIIFAASIALVAFDVFPESYVAEATAGLTALVVLVWGIAEKQTTVAAYGSLVRKLAVAVAGLAVRLEWISNEQSGAVLGLLTTILVTVFGWKAAEETAVKKVLKS